MVGDDQGSGVAARMMPNGPGAAAVLAAVSGTGWLAVGSWSPLELMNADNQLDVLRCERGYFIGDMTFIRYLSAGNFCSGEFHLPRGCGANSGFSGDIANVLAGRMWLEMITERRNHSGGSRIRRPSRQVADASCPSHDAKVKYRRPRRRRGGGARERRCRLPRQVRPLRRNDC